MKLARPDFLEPAAVADRIREKFGAAVLEDELECIDPSCTVDPFKIREIAQYCRDELGFDYLRCLTGVDYLDKKKTSDDLGVIYHLGSFADANYEFCVKVRVPRADPRTQTVENVWRTADWHEREAWDLVGIVFEGHHNLTRILCAEDWEGHPLRKDYQSPDEYHGIKNNVV